MKKTYLIILLATLFNTVAEAQMKFGVRAATGVILARSESTFTSNGYNDFVSSKGEQGAKEKGLLSEFIGEIIAKMESSITIVMIKHRCGMYTTHIIN